MQIAKFCKENVIIRGNFIKNLYGIYVYGIKKSRKTVFECRSQLVDQLRRKMIRDFFEDSFRDWSYKRMKNLKYKPKKIRARYIDCPYATEKDPPLSYGCVAKDGGNWGSREKNIPYYFILMGKDNCKKLDDCAIKIGNMLQMSPSIDYLLGDEKQRAESEFERTINDLKKHYFPGLIYALQHNKGKEF
jgi:hypothetical protein